MSTPPSVIYTTYRGTIADYTSFIRNLNRFASLSRVDTVPISGDGVVAPLTPEMVPKNSGLVSRGGFGEVWKGLVECMCAHSSETNLYHSDSAPPSSPLLGGLNLSAFAYALRIRSFGSLIGQIVLRLHRTVWNDLDILPNWVLIRGG